MAVKFAITPEIFENSLKCRLENLNPNFDSEVGRSFAFVLVGEEEEKTNKYGESQNVVGGQTIKQEQQKEGISNSKNIISEAPGFQTHTLSSSTTTGTRMVIKQEPTSSHEQASLTGQWAPQSHETKQLFSSTDFKEDLKKKILERRRAEGKNMIDLTQEEEERKKRQELDNHLTKDDIERRQRKRQQNNMAAKRCRENRKQIEGKMEKEMDIQVQRKRELLQAMLLLKAEKETLEKFWKDCSRGVRNEETLRFHQILLNKDYEQYIPKPAPPPTELFLDSDNSNSVSDMESMTSSQESMVSNSSDASKPGQTTFDSAEVNQSKLFSEMFQEASKRMDVHSEESVESSSSMDNYKAGRDTSKCGSSGVMKQQVIDLTESDDGGVSDTKTFHPSVKARNTLFELAEATYTEMQAEEELKKSTGNALNGNAKQEVDSDIDEEDFVPLVIDLAK